MRTIVAAATLSLMVASPALADSTAPRDRTGYRAIAAGDLALAERDLVAERRIFPQRPELMLNLAAVYARTGRVAEARALYDAALNAPAVELDISGGKVATSHEVARAGQAMLSSGQIASR
ncbi:tetratricopeptide repeat protein [Sphingomonas sp. SUN019]|uniref:tetratricopeptide repeat protein n=1 Tax=Sphingomonas sp. SUN019 TaxID=2937788 RepID=UPI0021640D14|nr:tetratricopeptide repeat protein [Sphingomonas sp. SUN019]UVO51834.1 tetratricopeptide repeat protein [Sphingomonas sp. SUN019]